MFFLENVYLTIVVTAIYRNEDAGEVGECVLVKITGITHDGRVMFENHDAELLIEDVVSHTSAVCIITISRLPLKALECLVPTAADERPQLLQCIISGFWEGSVCGRCCAREERQLNR